MSHNKRNALGGAPRTNYAEPCDAFLHARAPRDWAAADISRGSQLLKLIQVSVRGLGLCTDVCWIDLTFTSRIRGALIWGRGIDAPLINAHVMSRYYPHPISCNAFQSM